MIWADFFRFPQWQAISKEYGGFEPIFRARTVLLAEIGAITADRYSRIAARLKRLGTPIPSDDIWIAAPTMGLGAELITFDQHFTKIDGLGSTFFKGL